MGALSRKGAAGAEEGLAEASYTQRRVEDVQALRPRSAKRGCVHPAHALPIPTHVILHNRSSYQRNSPAACARTTRAHRSRAHSCGRPACGKIKHNHHCLNPVKASSDQNVPGLANRPCAVSQKVAWQATAFLDCKGYVYDRTTLLNGGALLVKAVVGRLAMQFVGMLALQGLTFRYGFIDYCLTTITIHTQHRISSAPFPQPGPRNPTRHADGLASLASSRPADKDMHRYKSSKRTGA